MKPADVGESRSEPWSNRSRLVPLRTYSGRVVHDRKRHYFTIEDVSRVLAAVQPPEQPSNIAGWIRGVIYTLKNATIGMLERLLPFLDEGAVEELYEFLIGILDKMVFGLPQKETQNWARRIIREVAARAGLAVTIKEL